MENVNGAARIFSIFHASLARVRSVNYQAVLAVPAVIINYLTVYVAIARYKLFSIFYYFVVVAVVFEHTLRNSRLMYTGFYVELWDQCSGPRNLPVLRSHSGD
ncbi:hypothetical protein BDR04DRAFT_1092981 [Suillus decipiens]|nr:hypothetical protein BDR04DRAFT_1092981 [Suillus decipiens]